MQTKNFSENKLRPSEMQPLYRTYGQETFQQLSDAQEVSRKQRTWGMLLNPRLWKVAKFKVGTEVVRTVVRTKASYTVPKADFAGPQALRP